MRYLPQGRIAPTTRAKRRRQTPSRVIVTRLELHAQDKVWFTTDARELHWGRSGSMRIPQSSWYEKSGERLQHPRITCEFYSPRPDWTPFRTEASWALAKKPYSGRYLYSEILQQRLQLNEYATYLSKKGNISVCPWGLLQSLISSHDMANNERTWTPAARIRSLASLAVFASKVPEASLLANTANPASRKDKARKAVQTCC